MAGQDRRMKKAQSVVEFVFSAVVFLLMAWGMVQLVQWIPRDLGGRFGEFRPTGGGVSDPDGVGFDFPAEIK